MERRHTIRVTDNLECRGVQLAEFEAAVEVNIIPESGDGFNEPREPGYYELNKVTQVSGPYMPPKELLEWAHCWVDDPLNQERISQDLRDREPF